MNRKFNAYSILLVVLIVFLFTAIVPVRDGQAANPVAAKHLKIGIVLPLSGYLSGVGQGWRYGYELFFDKLNNEEGGLKVGEERYLVDLSLQDGWNADTAATATNKLVYDEKVKFIIGGLGSDVAIKTIYKIASGEGVLHGITWAISPGGVCDPAPDRPLLVRLATGPAGNYRGLYSYLLDNYPNVKKVVYIITEMPTTFVPYLLSVIKENGIEPIHQNILGGAPDYTPYCTSAMQHKPDAVHLVNMGYSSGVIKVLRELGFKGPIISDSPEDPAIMLRIAGPMNCTDIISGGVSTDGLNAPKVMEEVRDRWIAAYPGKPFISDALMAWDEAWALAQAIEKAKSTDPRIVLKAFETMTEPGSIQTLYGPAHMGGSEIDGIGVNRVLFKPYPISYLRNGQSKLIKFIPPDYAGFIRKKYW
jgi:branched-chain amino acid transport system substrate-binding protein